MSAAKRILLVDDVPDNLSMLFGVLTARGYEVFVADSGELALEQLPHTQPDLILLDVRMPGIDGFTTCQRLKADARFAEVPVFFLTAQSDTLDKVRGFAVGGVDYITKPLEADEVLARIGAHLELRALRQALELRNEELDREIQRRLAAEQTLGHTLSEALVMLDERGEVVFATAAARALLAKHGGWPDRAVRQRWREAVIRLRWPTVAGWLFVEPRSDPAAEPGLVMLLLSEETVAGRPEDLLVLGVTPREAEVLFWIAQGKTSPEIAVILETASATVKRHVANLLPKLGVETRLAAALRAMEVLGARK